MSCSQSSIDNFAGDLDKDFTTLKGSEKEQARTVIAGMLRFHKQTDFNAAVDIAAHANQKLRDKLGNIMTDIWSRNASDAEAATGQLTSHEDIQTYMRDMLKEHVDTNKALLLKCDNDTLCTWILSFVTSWETQYRNSPNKYDIAENILSVMSEAVQHVAPHLEGTPFDVDELETCYAEQAPVYGKLVPLLSCESAVVRFYFRHPAIAKYMVLVAGKLLQRRECNRSGVYSSGRQRNDVARELERAVCDLKFRLRSIERRAYHVDNFVWFFLDHRRPDAWSAPKSAPGSSPTPSGVLA